jgi:hypothetical protein
MKKAKRMKRGGEGRIDGEGPPLLVGSCFAWFRCRITAYGLHKTSRAILIFVSPNLLTYLTWLRYSASPSSASFSHPSSRPFSHPPFHPSSRPFSRPFLPSFGSRLRPACPHPRLRLGNVSLHRDVRVAGANRFPPPTIPTPHFQPRPPDNFIPVIQGGARRPSLVMTFLGDDVRRETITDPNFASSFATLRKDFTGPPATPAHSSLQLPLPVYLRVITSSL